MYNWQKNLKPINLAQVEELIIHKTRELLFEITR